MKKFVVIFLILTTAVFAKNYKYSITESDVEQVIKTKFEKYLDTLSIINKKKPREVLNVYLYDKGRENYVLDISSILRDTVYYDGGVTVYANDKILTIGIEASATDSNVVYRINSSFDFILLQERIYEPSNFVEIYENNRYYDALATFALAVAVVDIIQSGFTEHYRQWKKKTAKKVDGQYYDGLGYYYDGKYYSYAEWLFILAFLAALAGF